MDTKTGHMINLDEFEASKAAGLWAAWQAGALAEMPQYAPIEGDKAPVMPTRRKRRKTKRKTYRDYCR